MNAFLTPVDVGEKASSTVTEPPPPAIEKGVCGALVMANWLRSTPVMLRLSTTSLPTPTFSIIKLRRSSEPTRVVPKSSRVSDTAMSDTTPVAVSGTFRGF